MADTSSWSSLTGALVLEGDVPLPKIWQRIHDNATQWGIMAGVAGQAKNLAAVDDIDLGLLARLHEADAANWQRLCEGAGATQMGAVGLSWCAGASLMDVWSLWHASGVPLRPTQDFRRPARLLNPDLVGSHQHLSSILNSSGGDTFLAGVCCARAGADLLIDVQDAQIAKVPPEVAFFILDAARSGFMPQGASGPFIEYWAQSVEQSYVGLPMAGREVL